MTKENFAENVLKNIGSLVTISVILQIIVSIFQLYQACSSESIFKRIHKINSLDRIILRRIIRRNTTGLKPKEREKILESFLEEAKKLQESEVNAIAAEFGI